MKLVRFCIQTILLFLIIENASGQTADFSVDVTSGCAPLTVRFTNKSEPANASFSWNFGNGNTSTEANPQATYTTNGNYTVTLRVTSGGASVQKSMTIRVFQNPITVSFSGDNAKACENTEKQFSGEATSDTTIQSWTWNFGDGIIGNVKDPHHVYATEGKFDVTLSVIDNHGCSGSLTKAGFIDIAKSPRVEFIATPREACSIPATVSLQNLSTVKGTPLYIWSAGGKQVSFSKDAVLTLNKYGVDTISLTIKDQTYNCTASAELLYNVSQVKAAGELRQAGKVINYSGDIICAGDINFSSSSIPTEGVVFWDFGDSTDISDANTGTHRYKTGGKKIVTMIASPGSDCADTLRWTFMVENTIPDFDQTPERACGFSQSVHFKNKSINAVSYEWKFADGTTSGSVDETRTYSVKADKDPYVIHKDESFTTTLTATSAHNCKVEVSKNFTIKRPTALFSVDTISGCAPLKIKFTDKSISDSAISSYKWFFSNSESITTDKPDTSYIYSTPGVFSTKLVIINKNGCSDTSYVIPVKIGQKPVPDFDVPSPVCQSDLVTITDKTTSNADSWEYFLNDQPISSCPSEKSPSFRFKPFTGTLTIKQKVGYNGCYAETTKSMVNNGPISRFMYEVKDCASPYVYHFTGNSQNATSCKWDFGDGTPEVTTQSTDHTFPSSPANKDYQVKLITINGACSDTMVQIVRVRQNVISLSVPSEACAYVPVTVSAAGSQPLSSICGESYVWNFNDSTPIIRTDHDQLIHTFTGRGLFRVKITAVHDNGCADTLSKIIRIYKPYSVLTSDVAGGCPGVGVTFKNASKPDPDASNPIVKWEMFYGDTIKPDVVTTQPTTFYKEYDYTNYFASYLKVTDSKSCVDSAIIYIGVGEPEITMTVQNPKACSNEDVIFVQSSPEIDDAEWDFGDGTKLHSIEPKVMHKYTQGGYYTVKVTATKFGCSSSDITPENYIFIEKAGAAITDSISGCPDIVKFTHSDAASNINKGEWNLGDGEIIPYDASHPYVYHSYKPGSYKLKLTVYSDENKCSATQEVPVVIPGPKGTFDVSKKSACKGDEIVFTIKDTADLSKFEFDFGDGLGDNSKNLLLKHKYTQSGKKHVALVMYQNTCKFSAKDSIDIDAITAAFDVSDTVLCQGTKITFVNRSLGQTDQTWDLGNNVKYPGVTPPDQNFTTGKYKVVLAVADANGCKDTARKEINVYPDFNLKVSIDTSLCSQGKVLLKAEGGDIIRWWPKAGLNDSTSRTPIATPEITTYYKLQSTSILGGCSKKDSILISVPQGKLNVYGTIITDTIVKILDGDEIPIYITDTVSVSKFVWKPGDFLSCTDCLSLVAKPNISLNYYLVLMEPGGCLRKTLHLGVLMDTTKMEWKAPDAFRPGTDEQSSYCMIHGKGIREILEYKIYNRWGNVVFSTTDINSKGWDGKYQGKDQPVDSYVWTATIKLANNKTEKKKGTVLLLR